LLKLLRPDHYIKNLFIFLPLFFALKITDLPLLFNAFLAFIAFSLTASAVYILNDFHDIEEDRHHPKKKFRPLASGEISKPQALKIMGVLALTGFGLMAALSMKAFLILAFYVAMNIAYSFRLKHLAILDVTIIAIGFVLRLFIGSAVTEIPLSMWIVVMTFLLALFMALAKRRDDVLIFLDTGKKMRKAIDGYNLQFLDTAMAIMASVVIVAYTIYTTSPDVVAKMHSDYLYLTALFVILGILRYLQIAFVFKDSGSPTRIVLKDRFMQATLLGWALTFAWILY
jgi:4-hydroxybenzoate polyprenyltransferase